MDNLEQQTTYDMKQRLELTWIGKGEEDVLEPRILIENPEYSYGDPDTGNLLIHGDNLLALRSLVASGYAGKVKCIYIDPPYNTGSAFTHYDDMQEHSIWLSLMKQRLELLRELLAPDGVIFISIDDDECHYLKVICDEVFLRVNYCGSFIWEKKRKPSFLNSQMGSVTEYVLCYARDRKRLSPFSIETTSGDETYPLYNSGNSRGILVFPPHSLYFPMLNVGVIKAQDFEEETSLVTLLNDCEVKQYWNTNEVQIEGEWRYSQASINEQIQNGEHYIIKSKKFRPRRVFSTSKAKTMHNLLSRAHVNMSTYEDATKESINLFGDNAFDYPKPEMLISVLIQCATQPGDLVLDSFLGSGTTAAVAHKMGRRYIGIELGDHAYTHCVPRLKKVIDGTDQGGITASTGWAGGGGFRFCELAPTLLNEDEHGVMVISPEYNAEMLAAAMALHEGFRYTPDAEVFWKQGHSTESDYIYTTTQHLTIETLQYIDSLLGEGETLLICCTSHGAGLGSRFPRITVKRIPRMLLGRCAFDPAKSYDLNIITLPEVDPQDEDDDE